MFFVKGGKGPGEGGRRQLRAAARLLPLCLSLLQPWTSPPGPPSMRFQQELWVGLPFPPLRDLPQPGAEPRF